MDSFLPLLLHRIQQDNLRPAPSWTHRPQIPPTQWAWIHKECKRPSDFDALQLRQKVIGSPTAITHYATCEYGNVIVIASPPFSPMEDIPWQLWGRILRLFHGKNAAPFTIYFLASPSLRVPPSSIREPIRPQHINGGYTYPCRPDTIVIYRAEDATRVLLHELQHASCLDKQEKGIDHVEAETEAWAEVLYIAFLSRGDPEQWATLWNRQWKWIRSQNKRVAQHSKSASEPYPFPWRYTLGKEETLWRWRVPSSSSSLLSSHSITSLRLTVPPLATHKREHNVRTSSVVL
jgi:hypothetical protein